MASRIIAVANQKGGVGKTTCTLGLAAAVANSGRRVLVIDMDPQSNASQTLLPDYDDLVTRDDFFTTNDVLDTSNEPEDFPAAIRSTPWERVDLVPSQQHLAHRDVEGATGIEMRLRRMLRGLDGVEAPYDLVLIDCPPSVAKLTVNSLLAAHEVLLISGPDRYGRTALNQIGETLKTIRDSYLHDIQVAGLIINMFEPTTEATTRAEELRAQFEGQVLGTISKRTVLSLAAGAHTSVFALRRGDAKQVADWFTDIARRLDLIGAREQVPATEVDHPGEVDEVEAEASDVRAAI